MATDGVDRRVLPIPDTPGRGPDVFDAKDPEAVFPPIEPLRPPEGAPMIARSRGFGSRSR